MKGYKYIIRAKKNFFKKQRALVPHGCKDTNLHILIDRLWQKRIKRDNIRDFIIDHPAMDVRLVKGHYEYDEQYVREAGKKFVSIFHPIQNVSQISAWMNLTVMTLYTSIIQIVGI